MLASPSLSVFFFVIVSALVASACNTPACPAGLVEGPLGSCITPGGDAEVEEDAGSKDAGTLPDVPACVPVEEACTGDLDEDCDGSVDEGCTCVPDTRRTCDGRRIQSCIGAVWTACTEALCADTDWVKETLVAPPDGRAGMFLVMFIDREGNVHIVYRDDQRRELREASRRADGGWTYATVVAGMDKGWSTSGTIDGSGTMHLVFIDLTDYTLHYASRPANGGWTSSRITQVSRADWATGIAVDAAGVVHATYFDGTHLGYLTRGTGGGWTASVLDPSITGGHSNNIAVDADGGLHVTYNDYMAKDLRYAYRAPGSTTWRTSLVDAEGTTGFPNSLALDAEGGLHVSYHDSTTDRLNLRYAYRAPGSETWMRETAEAEGNVGAASVITVDASGRPHIAYRDDINEDLRHAYRDTSGTWHPSLLDGRDQPNGDSAMTFDLAGRLHVAYFTLTGAPGELRYARRSICP